MSHMRQTAPYDDVRASAEANRRRFARSDVFVLDILAGSGSGKTSVILAVIEALRDEFNVAVIVGDAASKVDTRKINEQGIAAVRANAVGSNHLDGAMIAQVANVLDLENLDLILLENAGDLSFACDYDVGENAKVVISSVAEGDCLPKRCPGAFAAADAIILNKVDTLDRYSFDVEAYRASVRQANATAPIFHLSATTDGGVDEFASWVADQMNLAR